MIKRLLDIISVSNDVNIDCYISKLVEIIINSINIFHLENTDRDIYSKCNIIKDDKGKVIFFNYFYKPLPSSLGGRYSKYILPYKSNYTHYIKDSTLVIEFYNILTLKFNVNINHDTEYITYLYEQYKILDSKEDEYDDPIPF